MKITVDIDGKSHEGEFELSSVSSSGEVTIVGCGIDIDTLNTATVRIVFSDGEWARVIESVLETESINRVVKN